MKNIALLSKDDKTVLFTQTAAKMEMHPSIVEKDFWVCFLLDHLFHDCKYKDMFVFKGGTSLSKSYHVIERFSEDIDLILDWRKIINDESNPWDERSKTKQDTYNKQINKAAAEFYRDELVPVLNEELTQKLGVGEWVSVDSYDEMVVNFMYPRDFELEYIVPVVRLEIGPLAEWLPSHKTVIEPFVAEKYPDVFEQKNTEILTIDVERTFWEKITILHKMANFPEGKILPRRYARHLYDVYCLGNSEIKKSAFIEEATSKGGSYLWCVFFIQVLSICLFIYGLVVVLKGSMNPKKTGFIMMGFLILEGSKSFYYLVQGSFGSTNLS